MSAEVRGPHGLWDVRIVKGAIAVAPVRPTIKRSTSFQDRRGIVTVSGANGVTLADAWVRRDCEEEWEQAAQWLADLVGAAFNTECEPF